MEVVGNPLAAPLRRLFARRRSAERGQSIVDFALTLPLMAARCLLSAFPVTHNFTWDWSNHMASLWLFLLGWMAASQAPALWDRAEALRGGQAASAAMHEFSWRRQTGRLLEMLGLGGSTAP